MKLRQLLTAATSRLKSFRARAAGVLVLAFVYVVVSGFLASSLREQRTRTLTSASAVMAPAQTFAAAAPRNVRNTIGDIKTARWRVDVYAGGASADFLGDVAALAKAHPDDLFVDFLVAKAPLQEYAKLWVKNKSQEIPMNTEGIQFLHRLLEVPKYTGTHYAGHGCLALQDDYVAMPILIEEGGVNSCSGPGDGTLYPYSRPQPSCAATVVDELTTSDVNMIGGCLYVKGERLYEYSLSAMAEQGLFADSVAHDRFLQGTPHLSEVTRVSEAKQRVWIKVFGDCGGCDWRGWYLDVNSDSREVVPGLHSGLAGLWEPKYNMSRTHVIGFQLRKRENVDSVENEYYEIAYAVDLLNVDSPRRVLYETKKGETIVDRSGGNEMPDVGSAVWWLDDHTVRVDVFSEGNEFETRGSVIKTLTFDIR